MQGIVDLETLLKSLSPELQPDEYVFCTVDGSARDFRKYDSIATFREREGVTLVLTRQLAEQHQMKFDGVFKQITLNVHSSLNAVGLTAKVATELARKGISANVIAAFYHDHVFVPSQDADDALTALIELAEC